MVAVTATNATGTSPATSSTATSPVQSTATFLYDTFNGADGIALTAHTGEVGATWSANPKHLGTYSLDGAGGAFCGNVGSDQTGAVLFASGAPANGNQDITATFKKLSAISGDSVGFGRYASTATGTCYWCRYNSTAGAW